MLAGDAQRAGGRGAVAQRVGGASGRRTLGLERFRFSNGGIPNF